MVVKETLLLKKKNEALAKELAAKKNELKIEAALERVRRVAMSISDRADMLKVCKTISQQLEKLGVKDIRNVQTAIFYKERGTYMNYEYYAKHDKTVITETFYTDHKISNDFALKMMQGKGKFYITHIKGQKVKEWLKHQKKTNVFIDRYLEKATSLNYYWHSLGPVSLGISTYSPLNKDELSLFSRFLKVFELAYRRYLDIEKAETQANEAKIETSLEKVRAAAMGMYRPEDLLKVCNVLFKELRALGFDILRNAMINIHNDADKTFINYDYSDEIGSSTNHLAYNIHPLVEKQIKKVRSTNDAFSETFFTGRDLVTWRNFRKKIGEKDDPRLKKTSGLYYYFYSIGVGSIGISTFGAISEEKKALLKRFRNVFALAYQRYIDIAKAEAQAKEARIETALERVRAVAMAMKKSEELVAVSEVMYNELVSLGFTNIRNAQIAIENEEKQSFKTYVHSDTEKQTIKEAPYSSSPLLLKAKQQLSSSGAFYQAEYTGKELDDWRNWKKKMAGPLDKRELSATSLRWYLYATGKGHMGISTYNEIPAEQVAIVERFKNVFELSYQRFDDLQKAEAQAREARIETALERVRAVAMAMKTSDDLLSICEVLYKELVSLGFKGIRNALIDTFGEGKDHFDDYDYSDATGGSISYVPYNSHPTVEAFIKRIRNSPGLFSELVVDESELNGWKEYRKRNGQPEDPSLNNCSGLYYYMYSIGISSIGISAFNPLSKDKVEVLERFANVFRLAYQRYADISLAEAQAREAQIEAALERVRSRTMGMQKSEELKEVIQLVYEQLVHLNINVEHAGFLIDYKERDDLHIWLADKNVIPSEIIIPCFDSPPNNSIKEAKEKGQDSFSYQLTFEEKNKFYRDLFKFIPGVPEETKEYYQHCPGLAGSGVLLENIGLYIENFTGSAYTDTENNTLMRFGKVFQQTYTRFLDLQKAELQSREVKIQLALERARAQSMMMQHSTELDDTLRVFHEQVLLLNIPSAFSFLWLPDEDKDRHIFWAAWKENDSFKSKAINYPLDRTEPATAQCLIDWKGTEPVVSYHVPPDGIKNYFAAWSELIGGVEQLKPEYFSDGLYYVEAFLKYGCFGVIVKTDMTEGEKKILLRFAIEFERTYTRFLDLQKAEAQAREGQIQLALERVRARTMAMQKSEELPETSFILSQQMKELGEPTEQLSIGVVHEENRVIEISATLHGDMLKKIYQHSIDEPFMMSKVYHAWKNQQKTLVVELKGDELNAYNKYRNELTRSTMFPTNLGNDQRRIVYAAFFSKGMLALAANEPRPPQSLELLERFASVFDLTYTRFLDLQKAEAQAREAQIEVAVERVRAKALAMHKSEEILQVAATLKQQLETLDLKGVTAATIYLEQNNGNIRVWDITGIKDEAEGLQLAGDFQFKLEDTDPGLWVRRVWNAKEKYSVIEMSGDDFNKCEKWLRGFDEKAADDYLQFVEVAGLKHSWHPTVQLEHGKLNIDFILPPPAEMEFILPKMGAAFDLAYKRFLDLQKAEAQAKEAKIEAALERVRSRSLAMHHSSELSAVVDTLLREFTNLEFTLTFCIINLIDEQDRSNTVWAANPETGKDPESYYMKFEDYPFHHAMWDAWKEQKKNFIYTIEGKEKKIYDEYLYNRTEFRRFPKHVQEANKALKRYVAGFTFFKYSGLQTVSENHISNEELAILERFGRVFEQSYTRFLDLQKAEAQAKEAHIEAALERVRSRAMAMQSSEELNALIGSVFTELTKLDLVLTRCAILIYEDNENEKGSRQWMINAETPSEPMSLYMKYSGLPYFKAIRKAWNDRLSKWQYVLEGKDKFVTDEFLFKETDLGLLPGIVIDAMRAPEKVYISASFNNFGCIILASIDPLAAEHFDILQRFSKVFDLTYTRFNDLKQAEAQAREARIEAALEKVRSRSLAMHKSDEIKEVVKTALEKIQELNIEMNGGVSLVTFSPGSKDLTHWLWIPEQLDDVFKAYLPYFDHIMFRDCDGAREQGVELIAKVYSGKEKETYFDHLFHHTDFSAGPESVKDWVVQQPYFGFSYAIQKHSGIFLNDYTGKFFTKETNDILVRFSKVFEQAYVRFLDLQKAEAQTRESQIQLALERARAQSMMMQRSTELDDTLRVFHEQVLLLNIPSAFSFLWLPDEEKDRHIFWAAWEEEQQNSSTVFKSKAINYALDRNEPATKQCLIDWKSDEPVVSYAVPPEGVKNYFAAWQELIDGVEKLKPEHFRGGLYYIEAFMKYGCFGVMVEKELPEDEKKILLRFAIEFERTYTRFLDLQKAELQAREAEIELALERIRAKTMAMQDPAEFVEVVKIIGEQFLHLGFDIEWANFDAGGEDIAEGIDTWNFAVMPGGDHIASRLFIPYFDHPLFTDAKKLLDKYRSTGEDFFEMTYPKEIKDSWLDHMFTKTIFKDAPKEYRDIQYAKPGYTTSNLVLKDAWLSIGKFDAISFTAEQHAVLKRFGKAFGQANTRFLDLQKAEAQAREAQIEAALERVRAKTMGMHNSIDLLQVNIVLSEQLLQLGFRADAASFITDVDEKGYNMWLAKPGDSFLSKVYIPRTDNKITSLFTEALEKGSDFYTYTLTKEEKNIYFKNFFENSALKNYPEDQKQQVYNAPGLAATVVIMNKIFLSVSNFSAMPYSDQENMIIKRFAFVFQQSYTRFLDLQKAEAQAREAQIEASLERVRSKAMAMQKSEDLADAVCIVFEELDKLNLDMLRCGIGIVNKEKRCARVWTTTVSDNNTVAQVSGDESMDIHPLLVGTFEAWLKQEDFNYVLKGEDLRNYYKALVKVDFRLPDSQSLVAGEDERVQYFYSAIFPSGGLFVFSESELRPEAKTILRRFADVFNLTYTRFLDIQNAEAQAREAKIETALERVRSRALAMQEPEELKEVAQVMRNEMGALGVEELETSSIYIHGDSSENVECWYALQDPKHTEKKMVADHFILDLTATWVGREMKKFYLSNEKQTSIVMQGINRREWIEYCYTHSPVFTNFYGETIPDRTYHLYRFSHGYIGAAAPGDISAESWRLLSRAASVFSLAYSRFRDLTQALNDLIKLKEEKKRAEDALTELQSAQRQLVQSEKMASLGELTAGIAHEIQNPLNFVNNFSEVSKELLDEMKSELDSGNIEDAKEIMADVIQNLEKINHHGKRADGIVKGMLQHSRSSSGVKEPTDINALCDEYLRLSYHGLRAKDKTFNAKFETDLDNGIGKINIIPQEIGRVILNLINNAFYAVTERRKKNEPGYEPIVKVTSKKVDETVEIRVTDNGTGIPQQAIDKIFQPFFTTKPTGQGTGLGLSLSYDIITKGHGGELKVETKEGEGTEFIIQLPVV